MTNDAGVSAVTAEPMGSQQQKYVATMPASTPVPVGNTPLNVPIENEYTMNIGNRPKLYDLNKNFTNFEIEFLVQAEKPNEQFFVYIMPQDQLDKVDLKEIPMKAVEGKISGKVSNNNDAYQNYFLILKTDSPEETRVHIKTTTVVLPLSHTLTTSESPTETAVAAASTNTSTAWTPDAATSSAEAVPAKGFFQQLLKSPVLYYVKMAVIIVVAVYVLYSIYRWMFPSVSVTASTTAAAAAALASHEMPQWLVENSNNEYEENDDNEYGLQQGEEDYDEDYDDDGAGEIFEEAGSEGDAETFKKNVQQLLQQTS